jgi:hypothetical protein
MPRRVNKFIAKRSYLMDFEEAVNLSRFQQQFGGQGFKTRSSVPPGPCAIQAKTRLAQHYEMDEVGMLDE